MLDPAGAEAVAATALAGEAVGAATVGGWLRSAAAALTRARCESPRLDAELLLAAALGVSRTALHLRPADLVPPRIGARFERLVGRRAKREPVAFILGRRGFRGLELDVDQRVLIPRPETELLVEVGLELPLGSRVADVGTGSGAIALALKDERPDLRLTGIDASAQALDVARANATRLRLDVRFVRGNLLDVRGDPLDGGRYDAVLANLPYVADGDRLPPEIAGYEPACALYGGSDGLDLVRRLASMLAGVPFVALEVGAGQAAAVAALLGGAGFARTERRQDLAGHERVVLGSRIR